MTVAVDASKYLPPVLPRVVERRRLTERLRNRRGQRLVLVLGQAAQGKTTLVAAHLARTGSPAAWLHLGAEDSDHANFYDLLVCALQQALPNFDFRSYQDSPRFALGPGEALGRCRERLQDLVRSLPGPLEIVLDGAERLLPKATVFRLIEDLIDNLRPESRLVMTSREIPPLPLQRLRMQRAARILSNDDLSFTAEEIGAFFRLHQNLDLPSEHCIRLQKATGGWVGGVILLAESLSGRSEPERRRRLNQNIPEALEGEALRYFSEEIFSAQPEPVRNFLVCTSILDEIDPAVAADLSDADDADELLQGLVRRNLFIHSVHDGQHGELYRYNRLFQQFLRGIFRDTIDRRRQIVLFVRGGNLLWEKGAIESAIRCYLRARAWDRAAAGVKKLGIDLTIRGRFADLLIWLDALPTEQVAGDPWLTFLRTLTRRMDGGMRNIGELRQAARRFRAAGDRRGQMLAMAYLIEAAVFRGHDPAEVRAWLQESAALLQSLSDTPYYTYAKTVLWLQLGFGRIAGVGDLQTGLSACRNAYMLARRMRDTTLQINASIISVLGLAAAGEFAEADRVLERAGRLGGGSSHPEYRALQNLVRSDLSLYRGELDRVRRYLGLAREDIEKYSLLFLYPTLIDASGLLEIYRGRFEEADAAARHLSEVAILAGNPRCEALALRLQGLICYHRGRFNQAFDLTREALRRLEKSSRDDMHLLRTRLLLGLVCHHLGKRRRAERELGAVMERFRRAASPISISETHLALALSGADRPDRRESCRHLVQGLQIAAEKTYRHFVVLRPEDLMRACSLAVELKLEPQAAYAAGLLRRQRDADKTSQRPELTGDTPPAAPAGTTDTTEYRRRLRRAQLDRLEILALGGFQVLRAGNIPISEREWAGSRPRLLLKSILVHGGRDVPRDVLIEDLWPESRPRAAEQNFKVTLHRLRKVLEPELDRNLGSAYIHLRDHRVSLDGDLCRTDVESFLSLCKRIRRIEATAGTVELLALCRQARELYTGDFLPEEPYTPWVGTKRALLSDAYVEILERMTRIYQRGGLLAEATACCRALTRAAPCHDQAHRRLMELYAAQGMRSAALQVYDKLHAALQSELGVAPDAETRAAYIRLRSES